MTTEITPMVINGVEHPGPAEDRVLLVDYLRDGLSLTGVKVGCDTSSCGACVVLLEGRSVKSCSVLARQVEGSPIQTVEGVAGDPDFRLVAAALQRRHGVQCGFCTPGMIMAILGMLRHEPTPQTPDDVRQHLRGNYCRCTGYEGIVDAVVETLQTLRSRRDEV